MRTMGVDIIIAVDVEFPLYPIEELTSAVKISEQMLTILMRRDTLRQIELLTDDDILIRPELGTFDSGNFAENSRDNRAGRTGGARRFLNGWPRSLSMKSNSHNISHNAAGLHRSTRNWHLCVSQTTAAIRRRCSNRTWTSRPAIPSIPPSWQMQPRNLYGLNIHEQVSYRLVEEGGQTGVVFNARSKSLWSEHPEVRRFAGERLRGINRVQCRYPADENRASTPVGRNGRQICRLGTDPLLISEFYQPLTEGSRLFVAPRIDLRQRNLNAFSERGRRCTLPNLRVRTRFRCSAPILGSDWRSFGLVPTTVPVSAKVKVGDPALPND